MTTDITELAQRIPERKSHDWSQSVMHDCDFCNQWSLTVKHENGERICASCCDAEYTSKLEVANAELVEALEKAQQVDEELCKLLPPGVEYMDPPDGGDVTRLEGVRRMVADYRQRIADLESRTVKLPDDVLDALQKVARIRLDLNDFDGDRRGIADCLGDAEEALIEVVNRRAAMLQELQKSAGVSNNCRSNEKVQDQHVESLTTIKATPALDSLPKNAESRSGNSLANDTNVVKRLTITLPDSSSKAFWSGTGKTETFHPVTYRRWVKEAIERCCAIARIDVEVK